MSKVTEVYKAPDWKENIQYAHGRRSTLFYCRQCNHIIGELFKHPKSILHIIPTKWCKSMVHIEGDFWKIMNCHCGGLPTEIDINEAIEYFNLTWIKYRYSRSADGVLTVVGRRCEPKASVCLS